MATLDLTVGVSGSSILTFNRVVDKGTDMGLL